MRANKIVTDQNGVRYELNELIGRGGQGAVYAVKSGRLAVKIIPGGNRIRREKLRNQLMHIRRLPLSELALAKPLEMLRPPHTGYVMELLTDMCPITALIKPQKGQAPTVKWFLNGGGLRRRLLLLARAALVLSQLHGKGLAYSDPSPANIFVSTNQNVHEVKLIDTDNLQYESTPQAGKHGVFTPGFGAPELVAGKSGVTTLTDAFALAVLAYQCLTLAHPFIGDMVNDGPPGLEEKAFAGKLPWVDDPNDDQNRASFGIPRKWVLSPRLAEAFALVFGPGRSDPTMRPSTSEWSERLYAAADATVMCPDCSGTFFFSQSACPWCNYPRSSLVVAVFHLWDPQLGAQGGILMKPKNGKNRLVIVGHGVVSDQQTFFITRRLAFGNSSGPINEPVVSVQLEGNQINLKSLDGGVYPLFSPTGNKKTTLDHHHKVFKLEERQASWRLHFGGNDDLHRVVSFQLRKGENS